MDRDKIEEIRARVRCEAVLLQAGFSLDVRESSRRALKFRRAGDILIVTHDGAGWFDPLSERKGDVFALSCLLEGISFPAAVERIGELIYYPAASPPASSSFRQRQPQASVHARWSSRRPWSSGSPTDRYLSHDRALPRHILEAASRADLIRQGPRGSAWLRHTDEKGELSGWEERGPAWRSFSNGGAKTLFSFGSRKAARICISEAAIDALSLAALEGARADTLYASTGGGWSPSTVRVITAFASDTMLVAATDADPQGEVYADRLRHIAELAGSDFTRLRPAALDWNEELKGLELSR